MTNASHPASRRTFLKTTSAATAALFVPSLDLGLTQASLWQRYQAPADGAYDITFEYGLGCANLQKDQRTGTWRCQFAAFNMFRDAKGGAKLMLTSAQDAILSSEAEGMQKIEKSAAYRRLNKVVFVHTDRAGATADISWFGDKRIFAPGNLINERWEWRPWATRVINVLPSSEPSPMASVAAHALAELHKIGI